MITAKEVRKQGGKHALPSRGVPIIGSAKISATDIANSLISVISRFTILARAQLLLFLMPFATLCIVKFALLRFNFDNQLLNVVADVIFFMWWI